MKKTFALSLLLWMVPLWAQVDCAITPERSLAGAMVLGNGNPGSVNTTMIQAALNQGGPIRFNVGQAPVVINLTNTLLVTKGAVIDGGGVVTLSGMNQRRLFLLRNTQNLTYTFTVQNMRLINGSIPSGSGAAIYRFNEGPWQALSLEAINVDFANNHAIQVEQDGGGGAIYATGMDQVLIHNSTFSNNSGSNGGAFYALGTDVIRITDSVFDGNHATGNSGNPGNGGNAGAIGVDGAERTINVCRSQIINNTAQAFGVGFFSVMYDQQSLSAFTDVLFENNTNALDFGLGGGAYIQGGPFILDRTSFIANESRGSGGIFFGPGANGEMRNSTVYGNVATNTLGGGMSIDGSADVTLRHVTIVNNHAPCDVCFAGGIAVGGSNLTTLYNSILANNTGGNVFNPWNILNPVAGFDNLQFPQQRPNGQSEVQATSNTLWQDPVLSAPAYLGGYTPTMALADNSPAIDQATPAQSTATDQRLKPRHMTADLGAFELQADLIFIDGFD
ncbi:choice-of-anchor Q domain-containing protein [Marinicella meishanensis]|uniref:choice-of-anchor Q domain-containing protein n=1 Tax=Marinicella meishanensis TaxID=2873263 RepID=UPI001CBCA797|nr:choice-of-anchor Q domain-containing protein [Marinicella sp. NBU2979]